VEDHGHNAQTAQQINALHTLFLTLDGAIGRP
jgi:hypothetical protein